MEGVQLRDEAVQDRIRSATEFLDPSKFSRMIVYFTTDRDPSGDTRARRSVFPSIANRPHD